MIGFVRFEVIISATFPRSIVWRPSGTKGGPKRDIFDATGAKTRLDGSFPRLMCGVQIRLDGSFLTGASRAQKHRSAYP